MYFLDLFNHKEIPMSKAENIEQEQAENPKLALSKSQKRRLRKKLLEENQGQSSDSKLTIQVSEADLSIQVVSENKNDQKKQGSKDKTSLAIPAQAKSLLFKAQLTPINTDVNKEFPITKGSPDSSQAKSEPVTKTDEDLEV